MALLKGRLERDRKITKTGFINLWPDKKFVNGCMFHILWKTTKMVSTEFHFLYKVTKTVVMVSFCQFSQRGPVWE